MLDAIWKIAVIVLLAWNAYVGMSTYKLALHNKLFNSDEYEESGFNKMRCAVYSAVLTAKDLAAKDREQKGYPFY